MALNALLFPPSDILSSKLLVKVDEALFSSGDVEEVLISSGDVEEVLISSGDVESGVWVSGDVDADAGLVEGVVVGLDVELEEEESFFSSSARRRDESKGLGREYSIMI